MLNINTNVASLNAQRNLSSSQSALSTSLQRLSSGLRINSAKDDAAGMAISSRMSSQINGLDQAQRNANDGISLAQTAEGGLSSISDNLQRMRDLAVQAANGTNSSSDRASIQQEVSQLQQEINRVANNTQFNGQNLLDGTLNNAQFQVGANANQTINFSISSAAATNIGNNTLQSTSQGTMVDAIAGTGTAGTSADIPANSVVAQSLTIQGNGQTVVIPSGASGIKTGASAQNIAAQVNAAAGNTGVTASALTTATLGGFDVAGGSVSLTLQGAPTAAGGANPVTITSTMANGNDVAGLVAAINSQAGSTGITAVANTSNGTIALTQAQGYDIGVLNNTAQAGITLTGAPTSAGGTGTAVTLAANADAAGGDAATVGGAVTYSSGSAFTITAGSTGIMSATTAQGSKLSAVGSIDVTSLTNGIPTGANNAIAVIDAALANINSARSSMGAVQNRFTNTISNLQATSENLNASRSRIQDTDFAAETAKLSRNQVLQQAGTAMLAQANQLPQQVLKLLQ